MDFHNPALFRNEEKVRNDERKPGIKLVPGKIRSGSLSGSGERTMMICIGDLREANCTVSICSSGELLLVFPDHSAILDGAKGISVLPGKGTAAQSDAEQWLKDH